MVSGVPIRQRSDRSGGSVVASVGQTVAAGCDPGHWAMIETIIVAYYATTFISYIMYLYRETRIMGLPWQ
jgi:hypothetical protein